MLLILSSPLFLFIAIAIKLDSRGPVFFAQERVGLGERRFRMLKFRSMYTGTSDVLHREHVTKQINGHQGNESKGENGSYKLVGDARVTRVGRWLRRISLDELPQLVNVLRGEMGLVGPRPALAYELELYEPWQMDRLAVRPGMTGLWQVSGRSRLSYCRMCELDVEYVRRCSLWLDLWILIRTPAVVIFNPGRAG
jgi:lipopolysaccharide/colanic/teichoic acid biosynthesis glycosyltransferase